MLLLFFLATVRAFTPYTPTAGYTYYLEAVREGTWPSCAFRFGSYPATCDSVDLWNAAGVNQEWTFVNAGGGNFFLQTSCGRYLSYPGDCSQSTLDTWPQAGINQEFQFVINDNTQFEYYILAVGRANCSTKWASFPVPCTTSTPDTWDLWSAAGADQRWRIHPVRSSSPVKHIVGADQGCADPFAWYANDSKTYKLMCTGGSLGLSQSDSVGSSAVYKSQGVVLGGTAPAWASDAGSRWAPENILAGTDNYVFFAAQQSDGAHRIGWARSSSGPNNAAWNTYSSTYLNLGNQPGGDIDAHAFRDTDGQVYLIWKTDDNRIGAATTRIWLQRITISGTNVTTSGSPQVILDSTGLWWADSWVAGGSLIEGPEIVKTGGFYYLFFASGKYCQDTYKEGVARATSITGPYSKMGVPLLSNGIVGTANGQQLVGPGHASYVQDSGSGQWIVVFHASIGENCNRYPFMNALKWGSDGWPYADF